MKLGIVAMVMGLLAFACVLWFHYDAALSFKLLLANPDPGTMVAPPDMHIPTETKVTIAAPGLLGVALGGTALQRKEKGAKAALVFSTAAIICALIPLWRAFM